MRRTTRTEKLTETRILGGLALLCYATAMTAMLAFGYSALALALHALGSDFAYLLTPGGA